MSHTYLIDLYERIEQRLRGIENEIEAEGLSAENRDFLSGRAAALLEFKAFLTSGYDHKLPRRLRGKV